MAQWWYFFGLPLPVACDPGAGVTGGLSGGGTLTGRGRVVWDESCDGGGKRGVTRRAQDVSGTRADSTLKGSSTAPLEFNT
jgi:hypothetical protein